MSTDTSPLRHRRLAVVLRDLRVGGAERQATLLAAALAQLEECHVEVWCFSDSGGPNRQCLDRLGIPTIEISPGGSGHPVLRSLQLMRFLMAARSRRVDLLIPFTDWPNKVCGALWPVIGARGSVWNQRDEGREITGRFLEKLALRLSTIFVCNAASGERFLRETMGVPGHRTLRVRNWVRPKAPRKTASEWRDGLELSPNTTLVLMVANIHPFKDHPTLFHAWRRVLDRSNDTEPFLLLAGRPQEGRLAELKELARQLGIEERLRFLGEVDDIPGLLETVDLVVHSSRREGCPNAVLEAMACGVPVIATDIPGIREVIGEKSPYLVPERNPVALAEKLLQLLQDEDQLQTGAKRMQQAFENYGTAEENLKEYIQLLDSILH